VLAILIEEELVPRAATQGERLRTLLEETFADHPHVAEVRGQGLLLAIEVVQDRDALVSYPEQAAVAGRIVASALRRGVFFYGGGTGAVRDIVCMGPAFILEDSHMEQMATVLLDAVNEVTA